jgi:hypothetical protein
MVIEIVEIWQVAHSAVGVTRVRQACVGIPQLVEEGVYHSVNGGKSLRRCVLQQLRDQVDSVRVSLAEDLRTCKYGERCADQD